VCLVSGGYFPQIEVNTMMNAGCTAVHFGGDLMNAEPETPLSRTSIFSAAGPHIITQLLDGELTLINLDTGQYFAAGGPAVDIWEIVAAGASASEVDEIISSRYSTSTATVTAEVMRIMQSYRNFGLITKAQEKSGRSHSAVEQAARTWEPGWIEAYGDMKELLLLDPIHDVTDSGWPPAKLEESP
jgi:hypothetical protein